MTVSPWNEQIYKYSAGQLLVGSNPISNIEIVSSLNSFNLAHYMYEFHYPTRLEKHNPKVYLGTIQTVATTWNGDTQDPQKTDPKWTSNGQEKSGSCFIDMIVHKICK